MSQKPEYLELPWELDGRIIWITESNEETPERGADSLKNRLHIMVDDYYDVPPEESLQLAALIHSLPALKASHDRLRDIGKKSAASMLLAVKILREQGFENAAIALHIQAEIICEALSAAEAI